MAVKKKSAKKAAPRRKATDNTSSRVVSGMPDGSGVKRPNTRDDLQAAYEFTKKQHRRKPPK